MSEQAKFDHTVQVLVQAYLNNTLEKGNCQACAVGNLIAHAAGAKYTRVAFGRNVQLQTEPRLIDWLGAICTGDGDEQEIHKEEYLSQPGIKAAFDSTGYSFEQLAQIEYAFESSNGDNVRASDSEHQFAGLMAVVDVLTHIHGLDLAAATQAKALFSHA